jgi:ferredoxin-type protein NapH
MNVTIARRTTQVAFVILIFLLPIFDIFRYDTTTHELYLFGKVWGLGLKQGFYADRSALGALHIAFQFFLMAILPWLLFLALFPLLGFISGRFFCGWFCPEGALFELSDFLTLRLLGRRSLYVKKPNDPSLPDSHRLLYGAIALVSALVIPLLGGVALTGYFVAPRTVWHQIASWHFTFGVKAGIIGVSIYMLVTSIFVRHVLCKFICAAGLMQMLFGWISPLSLRLKTDAERMATCTDCRGCDRACFMNVTPRKNKRDISCVNCGACIDACNSELGNGKGLLHFKFGDKSVQQEVDERDYSTDKVLKRT